MHLLRQLSNPDPELESLLRQQNNEVQVL